MPNTIVNSLEEKQDVEGLLAKNLPSHRQAYSDRTSWLMACISELAYLRFNPIFPEGKKAYFLEHISALVEQNKKDSLVKLIDAVAYDHEEEKATLEKELAFLDCVLIKTFDKNGTQAILVRRQGYLILAFRGTETTSVKDIKSDAKAKTKSCTSGGKIHSGFDEAYGQVALDIELALEEEGVAEMPLFITGHSLGGALATIAAKKLAHRGGNAGCYTFGAPRVGDEEWVSGIKTPIYRVVNAADCVTMLPPSSETIAVTGWVIGLVPNVGKPIRSSLLKNFGGYLHGGNMRYMTNCKGGDYEKVKLLYAVSFLYRIKALVIKKLPGKKALADHSIGVYRKKLFVVARNRN